MSRGKSIKKEDNKWQFWLWICNLHYLRWYVDTLYNAILRIARNFLETRENIKIPTHPFYHINLGWFSWKWSNFFLKNKIQNCQLKTTEFFKINNSQYFLWKFHGFAPWVSRIDWCKGHWFNSTYMVVRLSDISS